jgi:exodeoxyribonuclease VII large subunit
VDNELQRLVALRSRPAFADPLGVLTAWQLGLEAARERARRATLVDIAQATTEVASLRAQVNALSPQGTLDRGYAVLQRSDGSVARDADALHAGETLTGRLAHGTIPLVVQEVSA